MPIGKADIKLMQSQRMTDNDDGGGRITGNEILDGVSNAIFPDVTDLDRVTGSVALRKVFPYADTLDTDTFMGSNVIVAQAPTDADVNVTLFNTGDANDERTAARDKIERYLVQSVESDYELIGPHFAGQQTLNLFAFQTVQMPTIGSVLYLESDDRLTSQYVRVIDYTSELRDFFFLRNNNLLSVRGYEINCELSAPLQSDFVGGEPTDIGIVKIGGDSDPEPAKVYSTEVADAARYYGIKEIQGTPGIGDVSVNVGSLFSELVPAAQGETPLVDIRTASDTVNVVPAGNLVANTSHPSNDWYRPAAQFVVNDGQGDPRYTISLGVAVVPGTVKLYGDLFQTANYEDDGQGGLTYVGGDSPDRLNALSEARINYATGEITFQIDASGFGAQETYVVQVTDFQPAASVTGRQLSQVQEVTVATRGFNWIATLSDVKPRPGTAVVSYMVLGQWYELRDVNGDGRMIGNGSGSVNYATGTISITTEELPDADSFVLFQWTPNDGLEFQTIDGVEQKAVSVSLDFGTALEPGTVNVDFTSSGNANSFQDDGNGNLIGNASGTIDYAEGVATAYLDELPEFNGSDTFVPTFNSNTWTTEQFTSGAVSNGFLNGTLPETTVTEVELEVIVSRKNKLWFGQNVYGTRQVPIKFRWESATGWRKREGSGGWTSCAGTMDAASGVFSVEVNPEYSITTVSYSGGAGLATRLTGVERGTINTATFNVRYRHSSTPAGVGATPPQITVTQLGLLLVPDSADRLVPKTLAFEWGGKLHIDDGLGAIVREPSLNTGSGDVVGTINYENGAIEINDWDGIPGSAVDVNVLAGLMAGDSVQQSDVSFRTTGAPIRSQSLTCSFTAVDGTAIVGTSQPDGTITGTGIVSGTINYETGLCQIEFDRAVIVQTGFYSAVLQTFIPLDADLIGLDPVRLPQDGRVPIFRTGDVCVVHHEQQTEITTPTAGAVIDLGRVRIADVVIRDSNGDIVPADQYTENLDSGELILADPVDTAASPAPWTVFDRIEDMSLVSDVEISGEVSLTRALSHNYPAGSYLSSALIMGDLQARVTNLFDQDTWTEEFSDERIGSGTTAEYNDVTNPIIVSNRGAITQRWALVFTGTSQFRIVGENTGDLGLGSISADQSPINPNNGEPYFTIEAAGWGGGWSAGNVLRFNTVGANYPIWIARTVTQSDPSQDSDLFKLQVRGNVNA